MFTILEDYKITLDDTSDYCNSVTVNTNTKTAVIYKWVGGIKEYNRYIIREKIHIALAELMSNHSKEKEEILVEEICDLIDI